MPDYIQQMAKAITGAVVAGLSALAAGGVDDGIAGSEWIAAAIAFLVGLAAVWAVPNKPPTPPTP